VTGVQTCALPIFQETTPNSNNTSLAFVHGSTDAPGIDVDELFELGPSDQPLEVFGNVSYNESDGYVNPPTANYSLGVTEAGEDEIIEVYYAALEDLNLGGAAISIFASGFLNPDMNNSGPEFGLWASIPDGGELIPLQIVTSTSEEDVLTGLSLFPNPSNGQVQIKYDLHKSSDVRVDIFDISGRLISGYSYGKVASGINIQTFDLSQVSSGMYFVNMTVGDQRYAEKLQIQKD